MNRKTLTSQKRIKMMSRDFYGFPRPPRTVAIGVRGEIPEAEAINIINSLDITYHDFFFHHMAKVWWFNACKNVPDELPDNMPSHKSEPPSSHWKEFTTPRQVKVKMKGDGAIIIGELSQERDCLVGCYTIKLNKDDKEKYGKGHIGIDYDCEFVERISNHE